MPAENIDRTFRRNINGDLTNGLQTARIPVQFATSKGDVSVGRRFRSFRLGLYDEEDLVFALCELEDVVAQLSCTLRRHIRPCSIQLAMQ